MSPEEVQSVLNIGQRELCHRAADFGNEGDNPSIVSWMVATLRSGSTPGLVDSFCKEVERVHRTGCCGRSEKIT